VKQWHEKRQKWCDYVQRLPEDLIFIHVFKETPPATIFSRVGHKITSLSLIYLSHLRYAFHPYSAHVSSIDFSQEWLCVGSLIETGVGKVLHH